MLKTDSFIEALFSGKNKVKFARNNKIFYKYGSGLSSVPFLLIP